MVTNIALPRFAKIGAGAVDDLGTVVAQLGIRRPVLVTDRYLTDTGQVERLVKTLHAAGSEAAVFSETVPDPTITSLSGGLDLVKAHRADGIIGFGGGSPMDTAKALAVLSANGGSIASYKAPNTYTGSALPVVAVPTTAGSGSEATQFTVITDDDSDEKMLCPGLSFLPIAIVVDFELTVSMPARLTADTGVDALTHAIEAYVSRRASPFSDALALAAMRSISQHLRRAYADGADQRAREAMMLASTQAGMAFSNSSVALVHGMSRPIGGHFHVAHGLSNAMLLPAVTKFSIESAVDRYADCAKAMGVVGESVASGQAATALVAELQQLCEDVEVPTPQSYGIDKGDWESRLEIMAEQALASGSPGNNPRVPSKDEIIELYREIY
ncbi:alcohol dehydrogenase [Mycolicibacterium mageritense DSM 44476 = CIP 104973]|uniref:Alcohol dehydrogenase n=1 Tax=Mycolicibacterium mageritense TaxID=53462 RepID=A0ABM7HPD9_MYCME|nr:iron-containing alcohol dehydrogenase [Mycolicibacterium mageritense]MCC9180635.1 iron-containing alcohol dehydrogenase [Mycolicibacterium mageritense]BBX32385.1 alcohol dehydrogenase [Mycolicibacterium mageritense]CDO23072.1 alcohol dehydrogenase [Mycolicibacterium mageritense DSM 44476 = CIP 104973]